VTVDMVSEALDRIPEAILSSIFINSYSLSGAHRSKASSPHEGGR